MNSGRRPAQNGETTCWSLIQRASAGEAEGRRRFAGHYEAFVRALLSARWRGSPLVGELEDAIQDVFVECFRAGGVLRRAESDCVRAFRPFLVGVVRNIARRVEGRRRALTFSDALPEDGSGDTPSGIASEIDPPSREVERAWARALMGEARDLLEARGREAGEDAQRRLALLELRFQEGVPIREIARRWGADPTRLHRDFDRARREYRAALIDVVAVHHPGSAAEVERTCGHLFLALQS